MPQNKVDLIVFDLIGTTVRDSGEGESLIVDSFINAFSSHDISLDRGAVIRVRGKDKREAIRNILHETGRPLHMEQDIFGEFMRILRFSLPRFSEMEGTSGVFEWLKARNIKIAVGSGLPMDFVKELIAYVGWLPQWIDYVGSSEQLGKGRPDPIMIVDAMTKLNVTDKSRVLKVGDTAADILEGKNAGVKTACVLSGSQSREALQELQPDYLLNDIRDLFEVVG